MIEGNPLPRPGYNWEDKKFIEMAGKPSVEMPWVILRSASHPAWAVACVLLVVAPAVIPHTAESIAPSKSDHTHPTGTTSPASPHPAYCQEHYIW